MASRFYGMFLILIKQVHVKIIASSNINLKFCNNIFKSFQLHFTYLFTSVPTPVNLPFLFSVAL